MNLQTPILSTEYPGTFKESGQASVLRTMICAPDLAFLMEALMLAQRTSLFKSSGTAGARAAAKAAADAGKEIIDLAAKEIWSDLAPEIRKGAIAAIEHNINHYTDTAGLPELRQALARKLSGETAQSWEQDEIAVTTGTKQALFNAAMVILYPGDEVIVPSPYWTTFPAQVLVAGGTLIFVETRHNNYVPKIEDIEKAITPATKAIVVNTLSAVDAIRPVTSSSLPLFVFRTCNVLILKLFLS